MPSTIDTLERDLEQTQERGLTLLRSTSQAAEAANREFTDDERTALRAIQDEGQALRQRLARARDDEGMFTALQQMTAGVVTRTATSSPRATADRRRPLSLGEQFVSSPAYDFFREHGHRRQSAWTSPSVELFEPRMWTPQAATLTEDPASGGPLVVPQYLPGILPLPQRPLTVGDLFAQGTTESNVIAYMREKTWVNAAATVLEGAAKPEDTLTFEAAQDALRKIAHWLPVTEEMLEDVAQIRSYIDARLRLGVQLEEEDQLLNGSGTPPDLLGILNRPGLGAPVAIVAPVTAVDAIFQQMQALFWSSYLMPDGIVMNPTNWGGIATMKSTTGEYLTDGPFASPQTPTLWGVRVVITPAIAAGTALVGAFRTGAQIFRKGGIRVEASNSHVDFFIKNLVAIRAEERLALAVYRPSAFGKVTGL